MATNKMKQEFQKRIKVDIDQKEHIEKVRESILRHKYGVSQKQDKGDKTNAR